MSETASGPVVFAYDGSDLAKLAIDEAGRQLRPGREALVLTVWQTFNVGFISSRELHIDAAVSSEVRKAAEETAAAGAALADAAGFTVSSAAKEAPSAWKCIVDVADGRDASLIVLGSHGRSGFPNVLLWSVAGAVAAHTNRSVLIVHRRS
jgi:nucleotide-binding universal stress UspA family protein